MSALLKAYEYHEAAQLQEARELDRYNTILAIAAQDDQDELYEDAAVAAQEARYEAWLSLEGPNP